MKAAGSYKMASVSRMTGLSPALLRAWERRYGLLQPERGPGGHRLYSEQDLQVLDRVKVLMAEGRSIGEIALAGRKGLLGDAPTAGSTLSRSSRSLLWKQEQRPASSASTIGTEMLQCRQRIVSAAVALDAGTLEAALDHAFALVSPEVAVYEVLEPSARMIGELWAQGRCSVAGEHLASAVFVHRLQKLIDVGKPGTPGAAIVLCACFPDEHHQVGALVLSYHLSRHGFRVSYLGAALPIEELERACDLLSPKAVYLSVTRRELYLIHRPRLLELLERKGRKITFFVGGCGIEREDPEVLKQGGRMWPGQRSARELSLDFLPRD